ncbi:MAG TPA: hypothetical protein VFI73_06050 [Candidatus Nitrosopolaris sp.]|nr:hypothetical protein [Candidatus Nitrosopolaris sp.]
MFPVSKVEIAETTKIFENAYKFLQMAFAEDIYLNCHANDLIFQNYEMLYILNGMSTF